MILVNAFVAGLPRTKGSMQVRNRASGALVESVIDSGRWRALMAGAVRDAYQGATAHVHQGRRPPYAGAVHVAGHFVLPVEPLTVRAGDLDKLLRNCLDALGTHSKNPRYNGGVIVDDNQVVMIHASKSGPSLRPGAYITVQSFEPTRNAPQALDLSRLETFDT